MASLNELFPILIAVLAFFLKSILDGNKKQPGKPNDSNKTARKSTSPLPQAGEEKPTKKVWNGYRWVDVLIEDEYRSLDPSLVPKDVPDINYDNMTNVSVPKGTEAAPVTILERIEKVESAKLTAIKKKFKEKNTLKELYLLSEIINKPKAFHKWQRNTF